VLIIIITYSDCNHKKIQRNIVFVNNFIGRLIWFSRLLQPLP